MTVSRLAHGLGALSALLMLSTLTLTARAQGDFPPLPDTPPTTPTTPATPPVKPVEAPLPVTAIVGGDVWTVTKGVIKGGTVLMKGQKIDKIGGPDLKIPEGATLVDAKGKVVTPGFISTSATRIGTGLPAGGRIRDSLDPYSLAVSLALSSGVTSAYMGGGAGGGGFGGRGGGGGGGGALGTANAVIKMTEGDANSMVVAEPAVYTFTLSANGRNGGAREATASVRYNVHDQFQRAKDYQQKLEQYQADQKAGKKGITEPRMPNDAAAVLPLLKKEKILRVTASDVSDIRWALKLVDDFGIRMVISPATEAWIVADEIAKRNVMLVITARDRSLPDERMNRPSGANPEAPGILQKAGVHFAILPPDSQFSTGGELGRDMLTYPLEAAFAMRGGADAQSALESITLIPAKILGLDNRLGSLEEGKDADILILSGDPLDYRTFVEKTFINGKLLYDKSKSTFFRDMHPQNPRSDIPAAAAE